MKSNSFTLIEEILSFSFTNKKGKTDFARIEIDNNSNTFTLYVDSKVLLHCSASSREQGIEICQKFLLSNV